MGGMVLLPLGQSIGKIILKPSSFSKRSSLPWDNRTDTNFIAEPKKMSGSGKSKQEHVPHFLHKKWKPGSFRDVSRCSHANQRQGHVQERMVQLDLLLFFPQLQGHPTTVFCKISVRRNKFWLKIFRWPFHSCTIFEAHLILLINSLRFSEV